MLDPFKLVSDAPEPLNVVALAVPVTSIPAPQSKFPGISMCPSEFTINLPTLLVESQILKLPALPYISKSGL